MGYFGAVYEWEEGGGEKNPSLKFVIHVPNDENWHSYALPKEDFQKFKSRETLLELCCHHHFLI